MERTLVVLLPTCSDRSCAVGCWASPSTGLATEHHRRQSTCSNIDRRGKGEGTRLVSTGEVAAVSETKGLNEKTFKFSTGPTVQEPNRPPPPRQPAKVNVNVVDVVVVVVEARRRESKNVSSTVTQRIPTVTRRLRLITRDRVRRHVRLR